MRNSHKVLFEGNKKKKKSANGDTCARRGKGGEVKENYVRYQSEPKEERGGKKNQKTFAPSVTQTE